MTFQIFKNRLIAVVICVFTIMSIHAQESKMNELIGQSVAKVTNPTPDALLTCIAELKRIDSMYPDSIQPKYQMALQSLNYCVMNPQAKQTESLLTETQQTIDKMQELKNVDMSDVYALQGFLYMDRIVQNPAVNGQRYYLQVMENYEKALKLNPNNALAKDLQQRFLEEMKKR